MKNPMTRRGRCGAVDVIETRLVEVQATSVVVDSSESSARAMQIFFDRGRLHGVCPHWRAHLIDSSGRVLRDGVFPVDVEERQSYGKIHLPEARLAQVVGALLAPRDLRRSRTAISKRAAVLHTSRRLDGRVEVVLDKGWSDGVWIDSSVTVDGRSIGFLTSIERYRCRARLQQLAPPKNAIFLETSPRQTRAAG